MQFSHKIVSIKPGDKVLDIGPGGNPHPKATTYLELMMSEEEAAGQRGYADKPDLKGEVVYYDGEKFPFKDKEFDYVVCSHVIEHVPNPEQFLSEMFRVANMGYLEYPTIYYEYLYNFDVHINFVKTDLDKKILYYLPKSRTSFNDFKQVHKFFFESLSKGYDDLVIKLKPWMFEGFEWAEPLRIKATNRFSDLIFEPGKLPVNLHAEKVSRKQRLSMKIKRMRKGSI